MVCGECCRGMYHVICLYLLILFDLNELLTRNSLIETHLESIETKGCCVARDNVVQCNAWPIFVALFKTSSLSAKVILKHIFPNNFWHHKELPILSQSSG